MKSLQRFFVIPAAMAIGAAGALAQTSPAGQSGKDSAQVQRDDANINHDRNEIRNDWSADRNDTRRLGRDKWKIDDLRRSHAELERRLEQARKEGNAEAVRTYEARIREEDRQIQALTGEEARLQKDDTYRRDDVTQEKKEIYGERQQRAKDAAQRGRDASGGGGY